MNRSQKENAIRFKNEYRLTVDRQMIKYLTVSSVNKFMIFWYSELAKNESDDTASSS